MIQFGNDKIKEIYHGSDKIKEVYHGNELVWSDFKPSYMILTDGRRIDFELENTPIANLCGTSRYKVINGTNYSRTIIKEIHFGDSYSGVTEIGNEFLRECTSLTNITLNFPALNSVGNSFLDYCTSLTDLTLNFPALNSVGDAFLSRCTSLTDLTLNFPALNSVGNAFLYDCASLTDITLTTETPPITNSVYFLNQVPNLASIYVPSASVEAYKTKSPWSGKSSLIKPFYSKPSYMIFTDGRRINFEIDNTPIVHFCGTSSNRLVLINDSIYSKDSFKEIYFGNSYNGVTIPDNFLFQYTFLTAVTLDSETPPTTSSNNFLYDTPSLTSIYVQPASVEAYKTTAPWSSKSSIIKAI